MDILFVTSMGNAQFPGLVTSSEPLGGSVLALHGLGARAIPERRFKG